MKSMHAFRLFLVASNLLLIFLAARIALTTSFIKKSTPFVQDILYFTLPVINGRIQSTVLLTFLFLTIAPTSLLGCVLAFGRSYQTETAANVLYTFQFTMGVCLFSMAHDANNRFDLELELIESMMQYNSKINKDDAAKWEATQHNLDCCGYDNFRDWFTTPNGDRTDVPDSCCKEFKNRCGLNAALIDNFDEKFHVRGCYPLINGPLEEIRLIYLGIEFILLCMPLILLVKNVCPLNRTKTRGFN